MTARQQRLFKILAGPIVPIVWAAPPTVIETSWTVVTGAPGAGKSTACGELEKAGHRIVPEASRAAITEALEHGYPVEEIFADKALLAEAILIRKLAVAQSLAPTDPWIWDTGLGDALMFCQRAGVEIAKLRPTLCSYRFRKVVFLEPFAASVLPQDAIRPQSDAERAQLHIQLFAEYDAEGYAISRIPAGTTVERLAMIQELLR